MAGKARCAVRAAAERRNQMRENTGSHPLNVAGDIATRRPYQPSWDTAFRRRDPVLLQAEKQLVPVIDFPEIRIRDGIGRSLERCADGHSELHKWLDKSTLKPKAHQYRQGLSFTPPLPRNDLAWVIAHMTSVKP